MLTYFETNGSERIGMIAVTREVCANGVVHIIGLSTTQSEASKHAKMIKKSHKKYGQLKTHQVLCRWENAEKVLSELTDIYSVKGSYDRDVYNFMNHMKRLVLNG